jgi:hypothetical protein
VLEGGYNVKLGPVSALAQSVSAHVRALMNTHNGPMYRSNENSTYESFVQKQAHQRMQLGKRRNELINFNTYSAESETGMSLRPKRRKMTEDMILGSKEHQDEKED